MKFTKILLIVFVLLITSIAVYSLVSQPDNVKIRYIYSYKWNNTCIYHAGNNSYAGCDQINSTTIAEYINNPDKTTTIRYYVEDTSLETTI